MQNIKDKKSEKFPISHNAPDWHSVMDIISSLRIPSSTPFELSISKSEDHEFVVTVEDSSAKTKTLTGDNRKVPLRISASLYDLYW